MSSRQIVIDYYDNLVNKIDILTEKQLSRNVSDTKRDETNSTRSIILDKIKQIRDLNLEYLKTNKIVNDERPENVLKPKVCYLIDVCFYGVLCRLIITRYLINEPVHNLLNFRSTKDFESNKDYVTSQILRNLIEENENDIIIDLSSDEKFKMKELKVEFIEDYEHNDLDIIENMVDLEHLPSLSMSVHYEFIFKNDMLSKFSNLTNLKILLLFDCTFEPEFFKCLTSLEDLEIRSFRRKAVFDQEILSPLTKLDKLELCTIESQKPIKPGHLLNIKNLIFSKCDLYFKSSSVENNNLKTLVSCKDTFFILKDHEFFKSFKSLVYLNLSGSLLIDFSTECFNYLENLEYLNLFRVERSVSTKTKFYHSELNLRNLKYLAIDCRQVPEFKHLQLEYLKMGGLRKFDSTNLRNQVKLFGLSLAFNYTVYNRLKEEDFNGLCRLAHLEIEITGGGRIHDGPRVDKEKCVGFVKYPGVTLTRHRCNSHAFMASFCKYYQEITEFMNFSDEAFDYICERYENGYDF